MAVKIEKKEILKPMPICMTGTEKWMLRACLILLFAIVLLFVYIIAVEKGRPIRVELTESEVRYLLGEK